VDASGDVADQPKIALPQIIICSVISKEMRAIREFMM
jgi:hypothetical protein